jgi:2-oxoisovalerate dehydrogenase E1 component
MPKSQLIDPKKVRKSGVISFQDIPVNQYKTPFEDEVKGLGADALLGICRDMMILREFETMLSLIKTTGEYNGIKYDHPGPAHLSVGQEASSVGQAFTLEVDDFIFGSHRSHGEILAKGLSAISKINDKALSEIMNTYLDGAILRVVEKGGQKSAKDLAIDYLIYGARRDFRTLHGIQQGPRRVDARFLYAVRHLPEQRHRRRLGRHYRGRGAL